MSGKRVLLVDENDDFLDGIASWLAKQGGLVLLGRAHSGSEAIYRAQQLAPDLILMDISLPDMTGFEAARLMKAAASAPKIFLMTFHESRAAVIAAFAAGADGCMSKSAVTEALPKAIESLFGPAEEKHPRWDVGVGGEDGNQP
jgi:DNA-binding NarL/FixJ family response regulator